jgi:hypothetical protein
LNQFIMAQSDIVPLRETPVEGNGHPTLDSLELRVRQLEAERSALDKENKDLRTLVERVIEHRQKSHTELCNLLTALVSKLPVSDTGFILTKLMEHNIQVTEVCAHLAKGNVEDTYLQPAFIKALEQTKHDLAAAVKPMVDELQKLDAPFEAGMLGTVVANPDNFFSPAVVRASRAFVKGQLPRERVVREFGEEALIFFKDLTTDPKMNSRPKPEEIVLCFKPDFEDLFKQNPNVAAAKRNELQALFQKVKASRTNTDQTRAQKNAFLRLSFILELLHYYKYQNTESADAVFAQRMPPLIEQLAAPAERETLDENLLKQAETLLAFIVSNDHRNAVINNIGKVGGLTRTLRFTLAFRMEKLSDMDMMAVECVKHLIPPKKVPKPADIAQVLRLFKPQMQQIVIKTILSSDRLRRDEAEALARAAAKELGLKEFEAKLSTQSTSNLEKENKLAWENIKDLIASRAAPNEITEAIRKRLRAKYDSDEVKQSWLLLTESDPMTFIRVFCQLPYLPDGQADDMARAILEAYATRLTHEKYAATYAKILAALKNLFKVKADSPTLVNFINLVKWVDPASAAKISADIGMASA